MNFRSAKWAALALVMAGLAACSSPTGSSGTSAAAAYKSYLYLTDTFNGHVGAWNPATHAMVTSSLVTTAGSAGEIRFYKGIGYVAVGSGSGAGVYRFDPSVTSPVATLVPGTGSLNAQYFAFVSATKAYFSVAGVYSTTTGGTGGVYQFDPSNLSASLTKVTGDNSGKYMQEIALGSDGYLYAAVNLDKKVVRINTTTNQVVATFETSSTGTTGLTAGTYNGNSGIYVANTGGSLDFIPSTASDGATAMTVLSTTSSVPFYPARIVQLSSSTLVASGYDTNYANHTYLVSNITTTPSVTEIKSSGASFGSSSLVVKSGLVYLPTSNYSEDGSSKLYIFDATGTSATYSPAAVMNSADRATNVAFYEE